MKKGAKGPAAKAAAKNVGVEIADPIRKRLRMYVAASERTIKAVVNEAIDEYLRKRGA
jgi:hypothetical protein